MTTVADYIFKTKPFQHQVDVFLESRTREYYALLMEQGTGKSKVTIDTCSYLYANGHLNAVLVVAPNGVQRNWVVNEFPTHCPEYIDYRAAYYNSSPSKREEEELCKVLSHKGMKVVAINIEALATQKGVNFVKNFLLSFPSMLVVDESSTIKNPKAIRTKNLLKLSVHAKYRRILTGTPVTQGPLDLFTQFSFLDSQILRCQSYFAFRNRYAILKEMRSNGRSFQTVVGYTNVEELTKLIEPHSYRVTKSECLDLPEKLYSKRYVQLSDSQKKLYAQLKKDVIVEFNGMGMSAPLALTKLLRLQQIVGGFFVPDVEIDACDIGADGCVDGSPMYNHQNLPPEPIDRVNPRIESLINLLSETQGKVIVWARFRAEIEAICKRIYEEFGSVFVEYHGGISSDLRGFAVKSFQEVPEIRFFVGNVQAGGKGLTLHAATTMVYYSNDFSCENRLQSEDRAHRIGQLHNVTYIDMIAVDTLDEKIIETLRKKKNIADLITGDDPLSWI